jgi:phosphoribosyl-dephospho-CoA transferase
MVMTRHFQALSKSDVTELLNLDNLHKAGQTLARHHMRGQVRPCAVCVVPVQAMKARSGGTDIAPLVLTLGTRLR